MRESTIARNYAEALFQAGEKSGNTARYADLIEALAGAIRADDQVRVALESPRVPKTTKSTVLEKTLSGRAPDEFVRFLKAVVKRGRQNLFGAMSREYLDLVDVKFNRVHAGVTLAREPDAALQQEISKRLSEVLKKEVIPHFRVDPAILGGVVVRMGDRTMDGSLRRKLSALRTRMLKA